MVNAANVVNPQLVNDGLRFLIAHLCAAAATTALSWLFHVPEIYRSNPKELNSVGKQPLSASESSNRVNDLVGFSSGVALTNLTGTSLSARSQVK